MLLEKTNQMITDDIDNLSISSSNITKTDLTMNSSWTLVGLTDSSGTNGDVFLNDSSLYLKYSGVWRKIKCDLLFVVNTEIVFNTIGSSFSAILTVSNGALIEWVFDGSTSNSATPTINYGTSASRQNRLKVTPWNALLGINIGYDGGDGGSFDTPHLEQQNVISVSGLENASESLTEWQSSRNPITSLNFSNFVNLRTIECYECNFLETINLYNTTSLERLCVENNSLNSLDISYSPLLEDLRAAGNGYSEINFGNIGDSIWHLCIHTNPLSANLPSAYRFPSLRDLFIWSTNQTGILRVSSTALYQVEAFNNHYTSANFSGSYSEGRNLTINIFDNDLTSVNLSGCYGLVSLDAHNNNLGQTEIDNILQEINSFDTSNGMVNLSENTAPSETGISYADLLTSRGWTVNVDINVNTEIIFTTGGASFSPIISVSEGATIEWTWEDDETSSSAAPTKNYGTEATRQNRLRVTPWSALTGINLGYTAEDGGGNTIALHSPQNVTSVANLSNSRASLLYFAASWTPLTSLDFSDFTNLNIIECYRTTLSSINLTNTPALSRLCLESNSLTTLDLTDCINLADLRAAANGLTNIIWNTSPYPNFWHICIRDNPQLNSLPTLTLFPLLEELYIWNTNQTGTLDIRGINPRDIAAYGNTYTSANFEGCDLGLINISNNNISSINVSSLSAINGLNASYNNLNESAIDGILNTFRNYHGGGYTLDLTGNVPPSTTGLTYVTELRADNWIVEVDEASSDVTAPVVTAFVIPSTSTSLTVSVSSFTASDAVGVTGFLITESATTPSGSNPNWSETAQTSFTFATAGAKTLYGWARDAAGNISTSVNDVVTVTLPSSNIWEDAFNRADGAPGNGWTSLGGATAEISTNRLHRTDAGAYRGYFNNTDVNLPADYSVTFTIPEETATYTAFFGVMGRYAAGDAVTLFWPGSNREVFVATPYGYGATPYDITVTGGFPASWAQNQTHTIKLNFSGTTVTISFDNQEYGYFTSTINNTTATAIGCQGDGNGGAGHFYIDNVLVETLPAATNMLTNGTFDSGSNWTLQGGSNIAITGGTLNVTLTGQNRAVQTAANMVTAPTTNTSYTFECDITATTYAAIRLRNSTATINYGPDGGTYLQSGHRTITFTTPSDIGVGGFAIEVNDDYPGSCTIDNATLTAN